MKKTLISHFYNEEYLLPMWLKHHKQFFDDGIMIDYDSTDRSCEIIKEICPDWKVVKTKNQWFSAEDIDKEVMEYENSVDGWRIALNITEFLIGNYPAIEPISEPTQLLIQSYTVLDLDSIQIDLNIDFLDNEIKYLVADETVRRARSFHNFSGNSYPIGRHYDKFNTVEFMILHFKYFPMNRQMIDRMLQIQHKCSPTDKAIGRGVEHHNWGRGLTESDVWNALANYVHNYNIVDASSIIKGLREKSRKSPI